eukprot:scaffold1356_cov498-Prasinococcus_capsulatus_cf.AAC.2
MLGAPPCLGPIHRRQAGWCTDTDFSGYWLPPGAWEPYKRVMRKLFLTDVPLPEELVGLYEGGRGACHCRFGEEEFFSDPRVKRRLIRWLNSAPIKSLPVRTRAELKRKVCDIFSKLHKAYLKTDHQELRARNEPEYKVTPTSAEDAETLLQIYRSSGADNGFDADSFILLLTVRWAFASTADDWTVHLTFHSHANARGSESKSAARLVNQLSACIFRGDGVDTITEADLTDLRRYLRSPLDNLGFEINEYSIGFLQYVVEETVRCSRAGWSQVMATNDSPERRYYVQARRSRTCAERTETYPETRYAKQQA